MEKNSDTITMTIEDAIEARRGNRKVWNGIKTIGSIGVGLCSAVTLNAVLAPMAVMMAPTTEHVVFNKVIKGAVVIGSSSISSFVGTKVMEDTTEVLDDAEWLFDLACLKLEAKKVENDSKIKDLSSKFGKYTTVEEG